MKKIAAALSVVAIAAITLVSCSKKGDYTCTCTINVMGQSQTGNGGTWKDVKKSEAQKDCDLLKTQAQTAASQIGGSADCTLSEN